MRVQYLVVHCTDTPNHREHTAEDIRRWHTSPKPDGNGWDDIGYHAVIQRDGTIEKGRPENVPGAHERKVNSKSLAVALVGRDIFTPQQYTSLHAKLQEWQHQHPGAAVCGHNEFNDYKACPNFNVKDWWYVRNGFQL